MLQQKHYHHHHHPSLLNIIFFSSFRFFLLFFFKIQKKFLAKKSNKILKWFNIFCLLVIYLQSFVQCTHKVLECTIGLWLLLLLCMSKHLNGIILNFRFGFSAQAFFLWFYYKKADYYSMFETNWYFSIEKWLWDCLLLYIQKAINAEGYVVQGRRPLDVYFVNNNVTLHKYSFRGKY